MDLLHNECHVALTFTPRVWQDTAFLNELALVMDQTHARSLIDIGENTRRKMSGREIPFFIIDLDSEGSSVEYGDDGKEELLN